MPILSKREVEMSHGLAMLRLLGIESSLEVGIEPAPELLFSLSGKKISLEHIRRAEYEEIILDEIAGFKRGNLPVQGSKLPVELPVKIRTECVMDNPGLSLITFGIEAFYL